MSTVPPHFNYAAASGFNSVAAAIIFAVAYIPLFGFFSWKSFTHPTYVHTVLALFCLIRLAAFIIRAVLCGVDSAGESLGLLIADLVLFGVGFAGLLYSAYTLVLDRELLHPNPTSPRPYSHISRLIHNRVIFRIAIIAGVALGITASSRTSNASHGTDPTTIALRKAGTIIFFVLTGLLVLQSIRLARIERKCTEKAPANEVKATPVGQKHAGSILCIISILLLIRQAFYLGTMSNTQKQNRERLWYPLVALMEVLAVVLFMVPGLVPKRSELYDEN